MRILTRYILRQFLVNYLILLVALGLLFVVVDLVIDLDEFLKAGQWLSEQHGGGAARWTLWAAADWYGPQMLLVYGYFSGLVTVGAAGFTFAGLNRTRELTAIVCSGVSLHRIAIPVLVVGCLLNVLAVPVQEFLIPNLAHKLARSKSDVGRPSVKGFAINYMPDDEGALFSAESYDTDTQTLKGLSILERDRRGRTVRRITSDLARWDLDRQGWGLAGGRAIRPRSAPGARSQGVGQEGEPVGFFHSDLSPERLLARRASIFPWLLSVADLHQMAAISSEHADEADQMHQIIHSRFSLLAVNLLVMVMGLPFFLLCQPQNLLLQAVKAAGICLGAWGGSLVLMMAGTEFANPVTAAWLPVAIYLPISALLVMAVRT